MQFDGQSFELPVFSLEGLVQWLEGQEPETEYDWDDCGGNCLIGHYYAAKGVPASIRLAKVFDGRDGGDYSRVCNQTYGGAKGWTYGAALRRARALLEKA